MPIASRPVIETCRITLKRLISDRNLGSIDRKQRHQHDEEQRRRESGDEAEHVDAAGPARFGNSRVGHGRLVKPSARASAAPSWKVIIDIRISWVASLRAISPVTRPSRMVTMRSRDGEDLRQFGRDDDDGDAGLGHLDQEIVHFDLRADVDAARRLVDDEDLRPERQPARQHDLLLIAAGEEARELVGARHADREQAAELFDQLILAALVDEPAGAADLVVRGDGDVGADGEAEEQGLLLAVLRHQAHSGQHRVMRPGEIDLPAVDPDFAGIERVGAEDRPRGLGPPGADQSGKAEDLALVRLERDVDELDRMGIAGVAASREPLDLERDRPALGDRALAVKRADLASDHHPDDRVDRDVGDLSGADIAAVAQDREPVAEPEHLLEPVGDEDDRQALGLERGHDAGEIGDFGLAQRRGRLVHDDEPRPHRQRPGDLDQLLLGDREIADRRHRVALEPDLVGDRAGRPQRGAAS